MDRPDLPLHTVVLAGGVGSRFWPASTPSRPKQILPLASERPLITETVERALALVAPERLHILASEGLRSSLAKVLPALPAESWWIEPRAKGTGPVLAWAAHRLLRRDSDAIMVSLHADHAIRPTSALVALLEDAAELASRTELLWTVAVPPNRPETGYGWIRPGDPIETPMDASPRSRSDAERAFRVREFCEKPDLATARRYLRKGYLWNSGIFVWRAATFLEQVRQLSPEIAPHLSLLERGDEKGYFDAVEKVSVDEAVLERSEQVGAIRATFEWDDLGSWASLPRSGSPDDMDNTARGELLAVDAHRNLTWSDDGPVVLWGVDDLIVIRANGITVVAPRDRSAQWKTLLDAVPDSIREHAKRNSEES